MKRIMIQADERLLERARRRARERGVSVAQLVRDALAKELGEELAQPQPQSIGSVRSPNGGLSRRASDDEFEPAPYR